MNDLPPAAGPSRRAFLAMTGSSLAAGVVGTASAATPAAIATPTIRF